MENYNRIAFSKERSRIRKIAFPKIPNSYRPSNNLRSHAIIPQDIIEFIEQIKSNISKDEKEVPNRNQPILPSSTNKQKTFFIFDKHKPREQQIPLYNGLENKSSIKRNLTFMQMVFHDKHFR